ncbi:SLATT domain-containing protein [Allokutzneria sp. A3M-2-11 16]|uniref:SLATT domain-containing protein n=1 Tax=Allokutzneria sp. A3M-2-11 16 TaxID=2962043 RepID=UPI0020B6E2AB|nr:SLATT domain-containing protein [Allokutzneria sp. A3M-2-11 16]MCP3804954.1 SLATT domain-containing protein [Allokutzneria sp. A3M-2-11 16]
MRVVSLMFIYNRNRLVAEPPLLEAIKKLENRSFATYLARVQAHKRIVRLNASWNTSLIALATSTTIASTGQLVEPKMYGNGGNALMVVLSVFSLVVSLVVSSVNYGARARSMEASYKRIQQISLMAERLPVIAVAENLAQRYIELQKEYEIAIESSENHAKGDHDRATGTLTKDTIKNFFLDVLPYLTLSIPVLLLIPFIGWFFNGL